MALSIRLSDESAKAARSEVKVASVVSRLERWMPASVLELNEFVKGGWETKDMLWPTQSEVIGVHDVGRRVGTRVLGLVEA